MNPEALHSLFLAHYSRLCRQALAHTGEASLAEGLVQDAFVALSATPATPDPLARLEAGLASALAAYPAADVLPPDLSQLAPADHDRLRAFFQRDPTAGQPAGSDRTALLLPLASLLTGGTDPADLRVAAYLTGLATPTEEHQLRHWVDAEPVHSERFEAAYERWDALRQHPDWYQPDVEAGWEQVRGRLQVLPLASPAPSRRRMMPGLALLLLLIAGGLWWGWPAPSPRYGAYTGPWPGGGQAYTRAGDSIAATFDRQGSLWLRGTLVLDLRSAGRQQLKLRAPQRALQVREGLLCLRQTGERWEVALLAGTAELLVGEEKLHLTPGSRAFFEAGTGLVQKEVLASDYCAGLAWTGLACP
ncbi:MAG: hypothetical protein D6722_05790 [Bacteroidetes bacterium]|nr:MAG: hypothetical protein D6722_05790 [Bacteroidota bacterium]